MFRKFLRIKSENFINNFKKFRSHKILVKYFGKYSHILPNFLKIILKFKKKNWKILTTIVENFDKYSIKIKIFRKIRRIILKNFENYFKKFRVKFRKFSRNNSDDIGEFRKIFRKISGIISENFAN